MKDNRKKTFVYYLDWAELLLSLPDTLRLKIDDAVKRYVLYGEEPTDREVLYSMFGLMRTQIDHDEEKWRNVCEKRSEAGKKHKGNQHTKRKEVEQTEHLFQNGTNGTNGTDNVNVNVNVSSNEDYKKKRTIKENSVSFDFVSPEFREVFNEWLEYKRERKETYRQRGAQACYTKLLALSGNDPKKARLIIEQSMSNNYAGLFELRAENCANHANRPNLNDRINDYAAVAEEFRRDSYSQQAMNDDNVF